MLADNGALSLCDGGFWRVTGAKQIHGDAFSCLFAFLSPLNVWFRKVRECLRWKRQSRLLEHLGRKKTKHGFRAFPNTMTDNLARGTYAFFFLAFRSQFLLLSLNFAFSNQTNCFITQIWPNVLQEADSPD